MQLLERDSFLQELDTLLQEALAGEGGVALVSGEAGIGKTSLVEQFVKESESMCRILMGGCDALFTPRPFGPLHDIASQTRGKLKSLLDSDAQELNIFSEVLNELKKQATILIIEDIHWADEATLDLIKYLGRRVRQTKSLIVLTYRDDEVGTNHPLRIVLGDFASSKSVRRLPLPPLSEEAVRLLASDQKDLDPVSLHRQTNGNPFFVTEVLASGGGIPSSVRDAVLARAARLSASGLSVLEAAAVIGLKAEAWFLIQVIGEDRKYLEECVAAGMLNPLGQYYAFRHELARQTILEAASPQRKLELNRLVLDALKQSPTTRSDLSRLVLHAEGANNAEAVLEYAPAAGRRAAAVNAHREAMAHFTLALRFADALPPRERAVLLEEYAHECTLIDGRFEGIEAQRMAVEIWRELGDSLKQGKNLSLLMGMYFGRGQTAEAEQVSNAAVELLETLPPGRELAQAYHARASLFMLNRDYADAIAWGEKAIELAERFNDRKTLSGAYNAVGSAWLFSDFERGREYLEKSLEIARDDGSEWDVARAYSNLGSGSGEVYRFVDAERYLTEGIAYTIARDYDSFCFYMLIWQALTYLHLGRWHEAGSLANQALQQSGPAINRIMALLALGQLRARRGDPGVWDALDEAADLAESTQTLQRIAPVRAARAEAAYLAGDHERCLQEARSAYPLAEEKKHPWFVGRLAFWRWKAGDEVTPPPWTAKPFTLQISGNWEEAAQTWGTLDCPYEQAFALADGDSVAQSAALAIFETLGAKPAMKMVRERLNAVPPQQIAKEKFGGLTEREREVAALIAQGKSNREIAEAMTVGVKTVETYVTRILNKLGFDSRVQIATWAVKKGLK